MSKYIDAEKLIAEIKRYKNKADERLKIKGRTFSEEQKDLALQNLCGNLLHFINSLQLEQSEKNLRKEIQEHVIYMPHGEYSSDNERQEDVEWAKNEFRHFYELGKTARKEE